MGLLGLVAQFCAPESAEAQGFYLRGGLGYAVPQAGQTLDGTGTPYDGSMLNNIADSTSTYSISKISFSQGVHLTLAGGYMFNEHIGVDLAAAIGLSMSQFIANQDSVRSGGDLYNVQYVQKAISPLVLMPSLVLQSGGEKLNIYVRAGLAIPIKSKLQSDQIVTSLPTLGAGQTEDYSYTVKNSFSLGTTAAIGARYKFSDQVGIYFEASMLSMSLFVKEADLNSVSVDGQGNYISQIPVNERNIYYSNKFTSSIGDYYHQPVYSQPFSNIMFTVGMHFQLGDQKFSTVKHGPVKKYSEEDHINRF